MNVNMHGDKGVLYIVRYTAKVTGVLYSILIIKSTITFTILYS